MTKRQAQQKIKKVTDQIIDRYKPEKIILFGSMAYGSFSPDSDVDMLIVKDDVPVRGIDRLLMFDKMIDRNGIALDPLIYKSEEVEEGIRLGDPFLAEIINKGKILYG